MRHCEVYCQITLLVLLKMAANNVNQNLDLPPWWQGQQPDTSGWTREQQACFRNLWSK